MIEFTRACARSSTVLCVTAVPEGAEAFSPETRIFRYEHDGAPGERWYFDDLDFDVADMALFQNPDVDPVADYPIYLSSEGEVYHAWWKGNFRETIRGAGVSRDDARGYGRLLRLRQVGSRLYACGDGGQIYVREGRDAWRLLTDSILFDPDAHQRLSVQAPPTDDPAFLTWLDDFEANAPRSILLNGLGGVSEDAIYFIGEDGTKPALFVWDGSVLHQLETNVAEGALTDIYVADADNVWICGREGLLLHGSWARGFYPVGAPTRLNLFHTLTPLDGKLVLASSVRPGGLYEVNARTSDFGRFKPALPRLRGAFIFFAGTVGDVMWVVGHKDIFRFSGNEWERIEHPDLP
ncbi:hypothetical protein [Aureimonas jatrophae]|uniref:Uncharacterized protein n=1 Tax=Aureimonas jatrophae TaxID=1166073 RepID=A0A1H0N4X7_9HYPH|nr:hypothetical protein [Aureimonas jatrophae]MBB3953043.1 hypothetical protein [Aureimonas jatrophae]SDO87738.1 hypothetical protein SAMN05192530_11734 [Aureimonas jatrophae]